MDSDLRKILAVKYLHKSRDMGALACFTKYEMCRKCKYQLLRLHFNVRSLISSVWLLLLALGFTIRLFLFSCTFAATRFMNSFHVF